MHREVTEGPRAIIPDVTTYRIAEAAELLGVSDDTMRRWVEAGRVASTRDGGRTTVVHRAADGHR